MINPSKLAARQIYGPCNTLMSYTSEICVAVISPDTTVTNVLTPNALPAKHKISLRLR